MNCFKVLPTLFLVVICLINCSPENKTAINEPENTGKKVAISSWATNSPEAEKLPHILEPCSESKRYQSKDWEGVNNCSWALEKSIIKNLAEYVVRDKKGLKFQTEESGWRYISEPDAMVNHYFPEYHLFILKYLASENCELYGIYDPKTDQLNRYSGQFFLHPNNKNFVFVPKANCSENAIIGRFMKGNATKISKIVSNSSISAIKWNETELAFMDKTASKNNFTYLKLP